MKFKHPILREKSVKITRGISYFGYIISDVSRQINCYFSFSKAKIERFKQNVFSDHFTQLKTASTIWYSMACSIIQIVELFRFVNISMEFLFKDFNFMHGLRLRLWFTN